MPRTTFLLRQAISELRPTSDPAERKFYVCGRADEPTAQHGAQTQRDIVGRTSQDDPWTRVARDHVAGYALNADAPRRVAIACEAGLGKTTNLKWLQATMARRKNSSQVPFLLQLNEPLDLKSFLRIAVDCGSLMDRLLAIVRGNVGRALQDRSQAAKRSTWYLRRLQAAGRITLLIDGLDHALSRPELPAILRDLLNAEEWRNCPVWVAGRPYAIEQIWNETGLFDADGWRFLRIEPLAEPEIRTYMGHHAGGDWYEDVPPEGRQLLAVPRLMRLVCEKLRRTTDQARQCGMDPRELIQSLHLRTAADVYHLAYFDPGSYGNVHTRGLLGSGLVGRAARVGLRRGERPDEGNYQDRLDRTAEILGAIAFEMFTMHADPHRPEPRTTGISKDELRDFKDRVGERLAAAGLENRTTFAHDYNYLIKMNNRAVDYLLFQEIGDVGTKGLRWHDRTVQAFFAAYWAAKHSTPPERELSRGRCVVDSRGYALKGFDEFWTFAAEMPDRAVDPTKWIALFKPCYAPPPAVEA